MTGEHSAVAVAWGLGRTGRRDARLASFPSRALQMLSPLGPVFSFDNLAAAMAASFISMSKPPPPKSLSSMAASALDLDVWLECDALRLPGLRTVAVRPICASSSSRACPRSWRSSRS